MIRFAMILLMSLGLSSQAVAAVKWNNPSKKDSSNSSNDINTYLGDGYIHEREDPNFETLRWSLYRKIHHRPLKGYRFHTVDGKNSYLFPKDLRDDKFIKEQMKTTPLLSYLLYENGKITIDEITPKDRFGDMFSNTTMFHSMSMGKSITSLLVGHAICDGKISSINAKIDDWPVLKGTLYHDQKLINFLNMATGDGGREHENPSSIQTLMKKYFLGTKKSSSKYKYNNPNTNIINSYLLFKYGEQGFKNFLDDIFINKIKIRHSVSLNKNSGARADEKSLGHQFFATRYDYLRIAKYMLDEWQSETCVGNYLKDIHKNRISKGNAGGKRGRIGLTKGYAGFFHTDYIGMQDRPVMGMDGSGGQTILIDFERGRIVATLAVFDNMGISKRASYDYKTISYKKIKDGKIPQNLQSNVSFPELTEKTLLSENRARKERQKNQKIFWDDYYDKIFFGDVKVGEVLLSETFENKQDLSVFDLNNNWSVKKEKNGNSIYCNQKMNDWTSFNFGEMNWKDYSIEYQLRFESGKNGKVETHIRKQPPNDYRLEVKQFGKNFQLELIRKRELAKYKQNIWSTIKLAAAGNTLTASVDGKEILLASDAKLKRGAAMIGVSPTAEVCIDNISVRKLAAPNTSTSNLDKTSGQNSLKENVPCENPTKFRDTISGEEVSICNPQ